MMFIVLFWIWAFSSTPVEASHTIEAPPQELCQLRGAVYVTENQAAAHYTVYVEEYETSADLVVYSEENRLFADQPGVWHFTDKRAFADFTVYLTPNRAFADFSIAYTDVASFAGCR